MPGVSPPSRLLHPPIPLASSSPPTAAAISTQSRAPSISFPTIHPQRVTIFIKNGTYEEIVFFRNKANLTFRGEDRDKVQVGYGNNSGFNPPHAGAEPPLRLLRI